VNIETSPLDRSKPKVLFLSRVHYKKGVDRLIKASAILAQRGVEHQLVLAGTGDEAYENEMKTLAAAEGIRESAYFLGFASGAPKISLIQACDLFALPTSQENFGFVFFEALASGTPVVTTKGTDTWPEIEQSGGGKIVDNTPEAFADAIEELLSRPEQVGTMGQEGRDWALSAFELERIANDYHSLYVKVSGASA
jgi:glycosyltransferase involved in cell wall biosynthesis